MEWLFDYLYFTGASVDKNPHIALKAINLVIYLVLYFVYAHLGLNLRHHYWVVKFGVCKMLAYFGFYQNNFCRTLFHITLIFVLFLSTTSVANPIRFSPDKTLIIGGNQNFAPFEFLNKEGVPDGYAIDVMKAVAKREGLNIKFKLDTWSNTRLALENKKIDAVTGMLHSKERDKIFDFSVPHFVITYAIFKRHETPIKSLADIKEKEVIVVEDVYAHDWLIEKKITKSIIPVVKPGEALRLLASGKHDCAIIPRLHGLDLLSELKINNIETVGPPVLKQELCFAVAAGNSDLLAELNEGLLSIQRSGEYDDIFLKWLSVHEHKKRVRKLSNYVLLFFSAVTLLLLTVLFWNWSLKRAVKFKTKALRQNETRLSQIVEGIPIPTYVIDEKRTVTHWNRACEALTGKAAEDIVGTNNYYRALYNNKTYSIVDLLLDNVLKNRVQHHDNNKYRESSILEGAYEAEIYFDNLGIEGRWLYGTAALLKDETGKINGVIETWQDLTGYKQLEMQLIQSQKMEAIGTLAGGIAHDFNNILSAVIGNAELALSDLAKESSLSDHLEQILSAGMRARDLVNQILTFSRQTQLETKPVQVSAITKETHKLFRVSLPSNIKIQQDIQSDALVMADATQIHQIVMNLCTNARQAMVDAGGSLRVRLSEVQLDEDQIGPEADLIPGKFIKLTVADTGHGVSPEFQNKIFDPFFTTKRIGEGTGMGLSVIHGIIKRYGGIINFDSEPGKGSTFRVFLPIVTGDASI